MNASTPVFDRDLALQRAGGSQDLAKELFSMLVRDLPSFRRELGMECRSDDISALIDLVHKLNGAATYCGVPALKETAHQCETALKQGYADAYTPLLKQLAAEIDRVMASAGNAHF